MGSYRILSLLGAGGMGEVYLAHDSKLGRDVAIKVLPSAFVHDPERLARFQREARMLASLNHPNIATIHGLEHSDGTHYLVMELVAGETLAERISKGALPVEDALRVAEQIAEALEAAHEKGVIHRDLKPANVKVTPEGRVKVLDFGLAKAFAGESGQDLADAPTLSQEGRILGTPAYMSPEQARGKAVDKRTDIWAFGCVLYELLTGKQAFCGGTLSDTIAAVLEREPDWQALPAATPVKIRDLLQRCLQKEPQRRLRDIGDGRIEIEDALNFPRGAEQTASLSRKGRLSNARLAWSVGALLLVGLIVALALGAFAYFRRAPEGTEAVRFFVPLPEKWRLQSWDALGAGMAALLAVSPDGHRVAFAAVGADGKSLLWVRSLDSLTAQALAGTDYASSPFWSPDSRFLGFFAGGKLKKIDVSGGPPITLCDAPNGRGGTWNRDGMIVFAPTSYAALQKVSAAGGVPTAATVLGEDERTHVWPFFLPDGRHFLYRVVSVGSMAGPTYLASLDSAERKLLLTADSTNVVYSQGHLLFLRETTLMAQPFDARQFVLTGDPFPIAEQIQVQNAVPYGLFSASENGVLAYQTGTAATGSALVWFDRTGKQIGVLGDSAGYRDVELSPDGKRASVTILDRGLEDVWLYDVARGLRIRLTFGQADQRVSTWSSDGSWLVFDSNRKGHYDLYQRASSGAGAEEMLLEDNLNKVPLSWSPDGRFFLYASSGSPTGNDLFVLPLTGDRKPFPFLQTQFFEGFGQFSPDGRWVAYHSDESGKNEVYVAPFPGPGGKPGKRQISTGGGTVPRWRRDGTEIFYLAPDNKLMAAAVNGRGSSFEVGTVKPLFQTRATGPYNEYDVAPDGRRFLINSAPEQTSSAPITVVVNWTAGLKK
jgi:Tol biopolymer transport system component